MTVLPATSSAKPPAGLKAKPQKAATFEEQRRSRIQHMQKLYGLQGAKEEASAQDGSFTSNNSGMMSQDLSGFQATQGIDKVRNTAPYQEVGGSSSSSYRPQASNAVGLVPSKMRTDGSSDLDVALDRLKSSMQMHETVDDTDFSHRSGRDRETVRLPSLPEDPTSQMSMSMGSSGGLLDWCKNLKPDEISPHATLANFFLPT